MIRAKGERERYQSEIGAAPNQKRYANFSHLKVDHHSCSSAIAGKIV